MDHTRTIQTGVSVVFIALLIALGAGVGALVGLARVSHVTNELVQLRNETNVATCISSNVSRLAIRNDMKKSLVALVPPGTVLTADQQLQLDAYNKSVDDGLPFRDCSPEGIKDFLEHQPPDPALEPIP